MSVSVVNTIDPSGKVSDLDETPDVGVIKAAEQGDLTRLEREISRLTSEEPERQSTLDAALCAAACEGHHRAIRCLLHHGAGLLL